MKTYIMIDAVAQRHWNSHITAVHTVNDDVPHTDAIVALAEKRFDRVPDFIYEFKEGLINLDQLHEQLDKQYGDALYLHDNKGRIIRI